MVLLLAVSLVVTILSFVSIRASDSALDGATFAPSLVAVIWLACYLVASYRAFGTIYLFTSAYVIGLFVFHLGLLLQDGFGLIAPLKWESGLGPWAIRAAWSTNLALACIGTGLSAYALMYRPRKLPSPAAASALAQQNLAGLYDVGVGLLIASCVLFVAAFANYGNLLALTRLELFHLSDTRFISVFSMMAPSAAIALLLGATRKGQRRLAYAVALFAFVVFLLSGQRTTALFPLMAGAVCWVKLGRRINPLLAGAAGLSLLLIIPVVGYLRTLGTYGDITNTEAISQAAEYADVGAAFREMGGSIGPLMYTLMLIPAEETYRYGSSYLNYFLDVIPNVGLQADSSTSREAVLQILRSQGREAALLKMNPGDWASFHIIPEQFAFGGGAGYSGIAEPYFNFGYAGILVYFVALGLFLGRLESMPLILQRNWLFFGVLMYWHLLPTVRNGFAVFLKPTVFILIAIIIWALVRRFFPRSAPRAAPVATPEPAPALRSKQV